MTGFHGVSPVLADVPRRDVVCVTLVDKSLRQLLAEGTLSRVRKAARGRWRRLLCAALNSRAVPLTEIILPRGKFSDPLSCPPLQFGKILTGIRAAGLWQAQVVDNGDHYRQ
jgi:hypothetical protein